MEIEYLKLYSKFLLPCESAIREHRAELVAGGTVRVIFDEAGGFDDNVTVTIRAGDRVSFGSDWDSGDATWFPARIKAAATALRNCDFDDIFLVEHADGELTIRQA
jgi:hypothetical protein